MSARKPLEEGCIGGVWCEVPGHVIRVNHGKGRFTIKHTPLTRGQEKALWERKKAELGMKEN
jgi:hypothetical protein